MFLTRTLRLFKYTNVKNKYIKDGILKKRPPAKKLHEIIKIVKIVKLNLFL